MKRLFAAMALAALTACGDGGPPTVQAVADKLGCVGVQMEAGHQRPLGAREEGHCTFAGEQVTIVAYDTNSARDAANTIAKEFGAILVLGDRWTVRVDSDVIAQQIRAKLGRSN